MNLICNVLVDTRYFRAFIRQDYRQSFDKAAVHFDGVFDNAEHVVVFLQELQYVTVVVGRAFVKRRDNPAKLQVGVE